MRLFVLVLLSVGLVQATGTSGAAPAPPAAPASPVPAGLRFSAELPAEHVAGFPLAVRVTLENTGDTPITVPDLATRPHLVRFDLVDPNGGRSERHTTPPAVDTTTSWTLKPQGRRQALIEVPSGGALRPGAWSFGVHLSEPAGLVVAPGPLRVAVAEPQSIDGPIEPEVMSQIGVSTLWVQRAQTGFDLYLLKSPPRTPDQVSALYRLTHLDTMVSPRLSRARPSDAMTRYIHWDTGPNSVRVARLDGTALAGKPRDHQLPWPKVEVLDRGATDGLGGLVVPLWVPAPDNVRGSVRLLTVDARGLVGTRTVADLPARPSLVVSSVDGAGGYVLVLGHSAAVDLYRLDPAWTAEIPARGKRLLKLESGWSAAAASFASLPEREGRAGGQAALVMLRAAGQYRSFWADLSGTLLEDTGVKPWTAEGEVRHLLPDGWGAFHTLLQAPGGWSWAVQAGRVTPLPGVSGGMLWASGEEIRLRSFGGATVVSDRTLGVRGG